MKTMKKIRKKFLYEGFGFPVAFLNVPMVKIRGDWTPDVDYSEIAKGLLMMMAAHPTRLTGSKVRFIRHYFKMTLKQFADRFVVKHPAVIKWENFGSSAVTMAWGTEKDIRLFVLDELQVSAKEIGEAYRGLAKQASPNPQTIKMDLAA